MKPFIVGQISDLHIKTPGKLSYRVVDCAAMLARCVEEILRLPQRPDVLVVTGDLVDFGRVKEYQHLRRLLAPLPMPYYLLPGNHDERGALRSVFADHAYLAQCEPYVQYAIEDWPLRLVALDTVIPGEGGGRVDDERLAWLEETLAESKKPTLLVMHHPPFPTLIGHMDRIGLEGSENHRAPPAGGAHPVRPPAPADPVPLRRHHRLDLPEPGAPGGARPRRRRGLAVQDGAARIPAARLAQGHGGGEPYRVYRRFRRALSLFRGRPAHRSVELSQ